MHIEFITQVCAAPPRQPVCPSDWGWVRLLKPAFIHAHSHRVTFLLKTAKNVFMPVEYEYGNVIRKNTKIMANKHNKGLYAKVIICKKVTIILHDE